MGSKKSQLKKLQRKQQKNSMEKEIAIFICTDTELAKEITSKYLSKDKLPYVTLLSDTTYEQATEVIDELK